MAEIATSKSIEVPAGKLKEALAVIVPKKKKRTKRPFPLTLHSSSKGKFALADSTYGAIGAEIDTGGCVFERIEVDGYVLKALIETFSDDSTITFEIDNLTLLIRCGGSSIKLPRLDPDGKGKTKRKNLPHTGKVEHPPDPVGKRAEFNDTWGFSAHVPMPESAVKDK
jgi:hypothetical protein